MPEVTVSMPARDTERYVGEAVRSVLAQRDVDFELIVVDDGSTDGTARVVDEFEDPRVTLLRNEVNRGIGFCHNLVLERCEAPFVAHVDSDDTIRPVALSRMVRRLRRSPEVGQAYCNHYVIGARDDPDPGRLRRQRRALRAVRPPDDVRRDLIVHGMVVNTLRTYRAEAIEDVGPFDEELEFGVDYEMALRMAERWEFGLVPDFLYVQRLHGGNVSEGGAMAPLRGWWQRARICERRLRAGGGTLLGRSRVRVYALLLLGLLDLLSGAAGLRRHRDHPGAT